MALTRVRNIGVDPSAGIDAIKLAYNFSNTGGAPSSMLLSDVLAVAEFDARVHFGAKGDGVTDDTAALNRALDKCFSTGHSLHIPGGVYVVSEASAGVGYCLYNKGVSMRGDGALRTTLTFAPAVASTVDMMLFAPIGGGTDFVAIENIGWWPGYPNFQTTVKGKRCIHFLFDAAGINMSKHVLRGNYFFPSNDVSVEYENNPTTLPQGNPSNSLIENNGLWGGLKLGNCGDSNIIRGNTIRAPISSKVGINIFVVNGGGGSAGHNVIRDNNIDCPGGAILIQNGRQFVIDANNIEISAGGGSSSAAVIDIDGASGLIINCAITNNRVGIQGTSTAKNGIRLNAVSGANVSENQMDLGTGAATSSAILITTNSVSARMGRNGYGGSWTQNLNNSGTDTKSVTYA